MARPSNDLFDRVLTKIRDNIRDGNFEQARTEVAKLPSLVDMYQQYLGTPTETGQTPANQGS